MSWFLVRNQAEDTDAGELRSCVVRSFSDEAAITYVKSFLPEKGIDTELEAIPLDQFGPDIIVCEDWA